MKLTIWIAIPARNRWAPNSAEPVLELADSPPPEPWMRNVITETLN